MTAGSRTVAVLGAGILGSAVALLLARRGVRVRLFDAAAAPLAGASRWNEGKIHLGHLYAADPTLDTARRLLPDGLAFRPLLEQLIDAPLAAATTEGDDTFVVHRRSVVDADAMGRYFEAVTTLAREHPHAADYLVDLRGARVHRLSAAELAADYEPRDIVAGFRVPERSLDTVWVADRLCAALAAEPRIETLCGRRVLGVRSTAGDRLTVATDAGDDGPFDAVVNATWEGRPAIDATRGLPPPAVQSHRYRVSVFARTAAPYALPSTVIATGPFGDVKNYGGRAFYLSWYPAGLLAEGTATAPPAFALPDAAARTRIGDDIAGAVARVIPAIAGLRDAAIDWRVEGGWVYAAGDGRLDDPHATLHRRDRHGIVRDGRYWSVDTGKYSVAPSLALAVAGAISECM